MPAKDKITKEMYESCRDLLRQLLGNTVYLGAGYVVQLIYELAVVIVAYESGAEYAQDRYLREFLPKYKTLVVARNAVNHNSYDSKLVIKVTNRLLDERVVHDLYVKIFGEVEGYKIFEIECYRYLEYMERLWR